MPREKERATLKSAEYKINGNLIRAFYDKRGKLVFVLDSTIDELKPNVLLVMNSYGDRKWDDVLSNDYGMDLELVRPKKDNKYQKLDVEYDGLDVYDDLIQAYQDGKKNLKAELAALQGFRIESVRRSATERLAASTEIAENARETIDRTGDTIVELQSKIKAARSKVSTLRRNVGKEPTKQSAAKILKAEAQMDVLNTKLERANKRLENANKRLLVAEDDIEAARQVLDSLPDSGDVKPAKTVKPAKAIKPAPKRVVEPVVFDDEGAEIDEYQDIDIDSDVKPLFDSDPDIMDDKIAFKPISFDEKTQESKPAKAHTDDKPAKPAMSFEPPKSAMDVVDVPQNDDVADEDLKLDDIFVEGIDDEVAYNTTPAVRELPEEDAANTDVVLAEEDEEKTSPVLLQKQEETTEIVSPDVAPNLTEDLVRPAAPVAPAPAAKNQDDAPRIIAAPVVNPQINVTTNQKPRRPNLLYYVLLLILIALSVFTLWLYQRSNVSTDAVPALVADDTTMVVKTSAQHKATQKEASVAADKTDENPFVSSETEGQTVQTGSITQVVGDSLTKIAQSAENQKTDLDDNSADEDEDAADKPEYNLEPATVLTDKELAEEDGNLCSDGTAPDSNGCCTGEVYSTIDGEKACCPREGGDCFPPMF
ncbi:MAG: hypothetical protein J5608_02540 [Alphaproteobacteria bacterium]|nr:hypothetical protein [Alphaproteobacteria bacterium]